jgi:hypothetical protein
MVTRPGIDVPWSEPVAFAVRLALTLGVAELSYRLVEMPIRRGALGRAWQAFRSGSKTGLRAMGTLVAAGLVTVLAGTVAIALVANPGTGRDAVAPDVAEAMGIADGGPLEVSIDDDDTPDEPATSAPTGDLDTASTNSSEPTGPTLEEIRAENGPVSVLGDSVVLGARDAITEAMPGAGVDAEVSRMPGAFTGRVKKLNRRDKLANTVVIHPASNGVINEEILRKILDPLQDYEKVVIVNASVPRSWEKPNNRLINKITKDYPNVVVADWNAEADGKSEYFVSDGVHLTKQGAAAFAELIRTSAQIPPAG